MGDLGIYASKFSVSSKSLREFDKALRFLVGKDEILKTHEMAEIIDKLLKVVGPISEAIQGNLSKSTAIDERSIIDILKSRHDKVWPTHKERILELNSKLKRDRFQLSQNDFQLLNDIADALDAECANLFRRMSGR